VKRLKIKISLVILLLVLANCAAPPKPKEITIPGIETVPFKISEVGIDRKVFNPSKGETVTISFHISRPAKVIIKIFDPDMHLIRDLLPEDIRDPRIIKVIWDGRDLEGNIVPDEAYFFTIEAMDYEGNFTYYDPTTISGGELLIPEVDFNREKGVVSYKLVKDARVRIRAGISSGGPLLKGIVNWAPRLAGYNEEIWDGMDDSGSIDVTVQKDYQLIAEAITLPENSIITYGNPEYDYFEYKNDIAWDRPKKEERPLFESEMTLLGRQAGILDNRGPEPEFYINLPEKFQKTTEGLPVVSGKVPLKIYLNERIKRYVTEQRYEIIFFVDFKFVTEMEEGYSPFTLVWNTRDFSNGEHIITVNVATLTGQVSSASMKVMVSN